MLGFSAIHSHPVTPPGEEPLVGAWYPRDASLAECAEPLNAAALAGGGGQNWAWEAVAWGFHYDDVPADVVDRDLAHYEGIARRSEGKAQTTGDTTTGDTATGETPPWYARRTPQRAARSILTPGIVASEAAAVTVPVLIAMGVRDLVPEPRAEPRAYPSARSIDLFVCPGMGHVHNMAGTRQHLWNRLDIFGRWCVIARELT